MQYRQWVSLLHNLSTDFRLPLCSAGRKVLGAFLNQFFPGVKDVVEASDSYLRARFLTKEAAKAAIKRGTVSVLNDHVIRAVCEWEKDAAKVADF